MCIDLKHKRPVFSACPENPDHFILLNTDDPCYEKTPPKGRMVTDCRGCGEHYPVKVVGPWEIGYVSTDESDAGVAYVKPAQAPTICRGVRKQVLAMKAPFTILIILIVLSALALAADFQDGKLVDVQGFKEPGPSIIAPNNGYPVAIPTSRKMFTITVALNGMTYSAQYQQSRHFKPSELIVGDPIDAKIDGDKLILRREDGKEEKARIIRRERLQRN